MSTLKSHYDFSSGRNLDIERKRAHCYDPVPNLHGKRFCEACAMYKPKGDRKHVKGWKCDDCMGSEK